MNRLRTGITGYDDMLGGGFLPHTANLVEGAPGTGKTTLGMQFIWHGIVEHDQPGLILTFEQFPDQYYRDAASFGWDFRALEQAGKLRVVMSSPEVSLVDLQQTGGRLQQMARDLGAGRILVDSITHFERVAPDPPAFRGVAYSFVNALKREGLTAVLTRENPALLGGPAAGEREADSALAFLADSYTLLRYVEIDSSIERALLVLKMRGSDHAKDIRQYRVTGGGLEVQAKFEGQEGILSGNPRRMSEAFARAFVHR
jgi:circadian clock protein KaiC